MKVGIAVECRRCGRTKAPRGRSLPDAMYDGYCTWDKCTGYRDDPLPGDLWPGETAEDFGYPCSDKATMQTAGLGEEPQR